MVKLFKGATALVAVSLLISCGGGGGGSNGSSTTPAVPVVTITMSAGATSLPANTNDVPVELGNGFNTQLTVRVLEDDGTPVADGTTINAIITPVSVAALSTLDDPGTTDNETTTMYGTISQVTSGGNATFFVHSRLDTGNATITASVSNPADGRTVTATMGFQVTQGPPLIERLVITPSSATLPSNTEGLPVFVGSPFMTQVTVTAVNRDGTPMADGTVINATIDEIAVASLSTLDDPETDDINEFTTLFGTIFQETVGGDATFFVHSGQTLGTAVMRVSTTDPIDGDTLTTTLDFSVVQGPDPIEHIVIEPLRTTIPANIFGIAPFVGSPYIAEVTLRFVDAFGDPINQADGLAVSINPVDRGGFSTLDDGSTDDVNEFLVILGEGPVDVLAGTATIFIHSFQSPGQNTLTVTGTDPITGVNYQATQVFTIIEAASNGLPAQIDVTLPDLPQYVQGSGGLDTRQFEISVTDGAGEEVPDPDTSAGGYNNVLIEVIPDGTFSGEEVSGSNAQGQPVSGTAIQVATTQGISSAVFRSGTEPGVQTLRITADRADNNVDNGISDPLQDLLDFVVSDGRLFSLEITSPNIDAITANRVVDGVTESGMDGTYSLTISAIGTDRLGNPVLPTEIAFNAIDFPISGYPLLGSGAFDLSASDGDPEESGRGFTAPTGAFLTAGGGAGPGDALMLFGEDVQGNRDHESLRVIESVTSATTLTVQTDFNPNDDTGVAVDDGPILPYVIGRAANLTTGPVALTDDIGVATTTINYPITVLGQVAAISAQGNGALIDTKAVQVKTVADVELISLPGIAPAAFSVSSTLIGPNTTVDLTLCLIDANSSAIPAVLVGFNVINPQGAQVTIDGKIGSGTLNTATDAAGCTVATIVTDNVIPEAADEDRIQIIFFVGGLSQTVTVLSPTPSVLFAIPNAFFSDQTQTVILRLLSGTGEPQDGIQIDFVSCTSTGSGIVILQVPPGVTDANGETFALVSALGLDSCEEPGTAVCTFAGPAGEPQAEVTFVGLDIGMFSPNPCEA